jgi:hypothetical protein
MVSRKVYVMTFPAARSDRPDTAVTNEKAPGRHHEKQILPSERVFELSSYRRAIPAR